jgi:hypothetical protein
MCRAGSSEASIPICQIAQSQSPGEIFTAVKASDVINKDRKSDLIRGMLRSYYSSVQSQRLPAYLNTRID